VVSTTDPYCPILGFQDSYDHTLEFVKTWFGNSMLFSADLVDIVSTFSPTSQNDITSSYNEMNYILSI
jgi:hypothetical protein